MKPGKTLLIIAIIIVVLLIIAWAVSNSNKKKTANAISGQPSADSSILGRYVASSSALLGTDYTQIVNGKPLYLWGGKGGCSTGYTKILEGQDAGWCILSQITSKAKPIWNLPVGKEWCCINNNTPCEGWKVCDTKVIA